MTYRQPKPLYQGDPRLEVGRNATIATSSDVEQGDHAQHLYLRPERPASGLEAATHLEPLPDGDAEAQVQADDPDGDHGVERHRRGHPADVDLDQGRGGEDDRDHGHWPSPRRPGTRLGVRWDQYLWPGTAPSRLKAKSIRLQLVMQAMVQKNWPAVEISSTVPPHFDGQGLGEDDGHAAAARWSPCPGSGRRRGTTGAGSTRRCRSRRSTATCPWPPLLAALLVSSERWAEAS